MDPALQEVVLQRLADDRFLDETTKDLVMQASEGDILVADGEVTQRPAPPAATSSSPVHAFLSAISVQGFRGIGPATTLALRPGPGLTLVIGRNGSGKSSFAEALEILLTGDNRRWKGRSAAWKEDWRNLHDPHASIEARFLVEGDKGPATIARSWADGETDVAGSRLVVQRAGREKGGLASLGWEGDLQTYRPFLSYNELGSLLDEGPSKLYDALSTVLGLEDLVSAQERLRQGRLDREKAIKEATAQLRALRAVLADCDDPRASACLTALKGKVWDLDALEAQLVGGSGSETPDQDRARMRGLLAASAPNPGDVARAAEELLAAAGGAAAMAGTGSARSLQQAELLEQAISFHQDHGDVDCPVCGTPAVLSQAWLEQATAEVQTLRAEARTADEARQRMKQAEGAARALVGPAPQSVSTSLSLGLDPQVTSALDQWAAWASLAGVTDPEELALLLVERVQTLHDAFAALQAAAAAELARREDRWRPAATALTEWVGPARRAQKEAESIPAITAAELWLKATAAEIRTERFEPIACQATAVWEALRGQSNVALERIALGPYPQRKVTLDVSVDGVDGAALGVMSQGELHSLALSLFLPRATLPGSPFGFIVIDDPVQSMDPARVDGLARVLEDAAKTRQVVVFTHDDRLPEACRRLQVGAEMIQVNRRNGSVVELARVSGPIERYLDDAKAIAATTELTEAVVTRVAGVFCRLALEAACTEAVVRRRLGRGEAHDAVEDLVTSAQKLSQKAALALFDDPTRGGEVLARLNRIGPWAANVYQAVNRASHQAVTVGQLNGVVSDTGRLADQLVRQS